MQSYDYHNKTLTLGDYVRVTGEKRDADTGKVGKVIRVRTGGVVVRFGSEAEHSESTWHPSRLELVKEHA